MHHRMVTLMACGFAITACYALGLGVQALDVTGLRAPLIALLALVVLMAVRYYRLPPPGPVFIVMAAAIGAYTPVPFRSEEHTSELQQLIRISYAVFCL